MTVTAAQFRARFGEFRKASDAAVTDALDRASRQVNPDVWAAATDDGVMAFAAHLLKAGSGGKDMPTDYLAQYDAIRNSLCAGPGIY